MKIIGSVKLEGGRLLTAKNASKITARKIIATDKYGNRILLKPDGTIIGPFGPTQAYYQVWKIHRDENGYCWREVTHGGGICGYAENIRELVIKTIFGLCYDIVIEVEEGAQ